MKESQFQTKVISHLKTLPKCWLVKVWGGGFQKAGIPDIICCINGHFVAIELKKEGGKPSELQKVNIKKIIDSGGIGLILYPHEFEDFKELTKELSK